MLVIISDLHLTDGTTGKTIGASAFLDFRQRLQDLAYDASHRSDGTYQPIESLDLLMLGDVFDMIRSTKWTEQTKGEAGYIRPWHDPNSDLFIQKIQEVTDAILDVNEESFKVLHDLSHNKPLTIPHAQDGRRRTIVKTRIFYLVGNHDWFLHLPGRPYDAIRQKINKTLGLSNPNGPYPHDPEKTHWLMEIYKAHNVFARHGDIYDPFNYDEEKGRNAATLGDAFVVELINRFPQEVRRRLSDELPDILLNGLDELANVRPSLLVPAWIDIQMRNLDVSEQLQRKVKNVWDELANHFLSLDFVRDKDKRFKLDAVDVLEAALKLYDNVSTRTASDVLRFVQKKLWGGSTSFAGHALQETAFKERWAHHIIYGHTHHYELVPLDKVYVGHEWFNQIYYNSGTWHPIHEIAKANDKEFIFFHVMTFLAYFKADERKGRPFETWTGSLGLRSSD